MKNTKENKEKFFAQYWGLYVGCYYQLDKSVMRYTLDGNNIDESTMDGDWLELTPLSKITHDDAIKVARIIGFGGESDHAINCGKHVCKHLFDFESNQIFVKKGLRLFDYLRSKGYALPYNGLSVEELINRGWIKLK